MKEWDELLRGAESVKLIGGFRCQLTLGEMNEWHEYVLDLPEHIDYLYRCDLRQSAIKRNLSARGLVSDELAAGKRLYDIGKAWYAGLCDRRAAKELADAQAKIPEDEP